MIPAEPWQLLVLALCWGLYFALHSALAMLRVKAWVVTHLPVLMPAYRLAYNAAALTFFMPLLLLMRRWGGAILWQWEGAAAYVSDGVAVLAGLGILWTFRDYDLMEFLGIRQVRGGIRSVEDQEQLKFTPLHQVVRHPWYFLALVAIWTRDVNQAFLVSALCWTGYLVLGSRMEEARLIYMHGEVYRRYRTYVPGLIPLPWRYLRTSDLKNLQALNAKQRRSGDETNRP